MNPDMTQEDWRRQEERVREQEWLLQVESLRREVAQLKQVNQDLQLTLSTTAEHGDTMEALLQEANQKLQREIEQRQRVEERLQGILKTLSQDKQDLEIILHTTTVHGDTVEYMLYNQAVEAIRQSEELFRAIAESTPVAMLLSQIPEGTIQYANSTTAQLLELEVQTLIGARLQSFYHDPRVELDIQTLLGQEGCVRNYELQLKKADGSSCWVIASFQMISLREKPTLLSTFCNITERKYMEEALRQQKQELEAMIEKQTEELRRSEQKYRNIVENAVEGICQTTPEGRYLSANPSLARLYGYESPDDLKNNLTNIGKQLYVQPGRWDEIQVYVQQFNSVPDLKSQVYRKDGSMIWISESIRTVRDAEGMLVYYEGSVRDITEQQKAEAELRLQRQTSERLLLNILPQKIAEKLKRERGKIADNFDKVTVLFGDIVNFTELADSVSPIQLVDFLNQIFSTFDSLVENNHLEKIKTIGDAYMVVGGLPSPMPNHADAIAQLALGMQQAIARFERHDGKPLRLRIGIHTGPVVAGVIGRKKFIYDLWGDTVNIASRMESQGEPGKIQVTAAVYEQLKDRYIFEKRGEIAIKGKGKMMTYWLVG